MRKYEFYVDFGSWGYTSTIIAEDIVDAKMSLMEALDGKYTIKRVTESIVQDKK